MTGTSKKIDPLDAVRAARKQYETHDATYRMEGYKILGKIARIARQFEKDEKAYEAFLQDPFLSSLQKAKGRKRDLTNPLRPVMYFVTGADTRSKQKSVDKRIAVIEYLRSERIKTNKMAAYIQDNGGLEQVLQQSRRSEDGESIVVPKLEDGYGYLYIKGTHDQIARACQNDWDTFPFEIVREDLEHEGFVKLCLHQFVCNFDIDLSDC